MTVLGDQMDGVLARDGDPEESAGLGKGRGGGGSGVMVLVGPQVEMALS